MDTFVQKNKVNLTDFNFLNIDVQGVELQVIRSFGNAIRLMDYIYSEVNEAELYKGCCLVQEIDDYLDVFGFKRAETYMTPKQWGDALYVRKDLL
jgi:N-acetylglutamate synthase-like GNAT family acetyltransferase